MLNAFIFTTLLASASAPPSYAYAHHPVSSNPQVQALFDRGLTLFYAYNGTEGVHVFQQAEKLDPNVAMAYWGEALSYGSDINQDVDEARFAKAHAAIEKAAALETSATMEERVYIEAMRQRYAGSWRDRSKDELAYRAAMGELAKNYPDDDDAGSLWVEALLEDLHVDTLFESGTSSPARPETQPMLDRLNAIIAHDPWHLMANHLIVHIYEASTDRAPAVLAADRLSSLHFAPEDEHLAHMPAHTYVDVGNYGGAVAASERAIALFRTYDATPGIDRGHDGYYYHDFDIGFGAGMMLGDQGTMQRYVADSAPAELRTRYEQVSAARFAQWSTLLQNRAKAADDFATMARALAELETGDLAAAKADDAAVKLDPKRKSYSGRMLSYLVAAKVAAASGNRDRALALFAEGQKLERDAYWGETLPYFPMGEALGATYYAWGDYADSEKAFRETIARYPNDARALFGLAEADRKLGKSDDAATAYERFSLQWRGSPVHLTMQEL
ncbi:MAG: tetratricopeptide repeat protein [Candidatus Eremiobacteraeota bacterium]|nr:tetratricopeptide repeat protein [Candidatus Eremiobacteraeota bacterium]